MRKESTFQKQAFEQTEDVYAATSANEFFAECFQQYYLAPGTLAKNCPKAYKFIKRTVQIDFPKIAGIVW